MVGSMAAKAFHVVKRGYELWSPDSWLQVCYPLFYLAKATSKDRERRNGQKGRAQGVEMAIPIAIMCLLSWILWMNGRFVLQDLFTKKDEDESPLSEIEKKAEEENTEGESSLRSGAMITERHLNTALETGLSQNEVSERQEIYGPNDFLESRDWFRIFRDTCLSGISLPLEVRIVEASRDDC